MCGLCVYACVRVYVRVCDGDDMEGYFCEYARAYACAYVCVYVWCLYVCVTVGRGHSF